MTRLRSQFLVAVASIVALCAPRVSAAGALGPAWADPVTTVEGVSEYRLPNGLRVLLAPDQSSSNLYVNVVYFVGSRHEGRGEKGMAHLLEHMLFKGTPTFSDPNKSLKEHGASSNAQTWTDRTTYFESMTATDENLEFALRFEADRMVNSFIAAEALEKEMTVVRNEFETGEGDAFGLMMRNLFTHAYRWHPYRDATIGNRSDIERVPADNLRRYYKHHYRPANALLVLSGGFDSKKALELVERHFAGLTNPSEPIVDTWTDEPIQDGPRHFEIQREGSLTYVGVLYRTPAASHPDATAAQFFNPLLSDTPWGRLHEALVDGNLANGASVLPLGMAECGQVLVIAAVKEGQNARSALAKIIEVMEGFGKNPVTQEELNRARASLRSQRKGTTNAQAIGFVLTDAAAIGDWRLFFIERDRIKAMTAEDVQDVAVKYFVESNRTSGIFIPTKSPLRATVPPRPDIAALVDGYKGTETVVEGEAFDATPANIEARTIRSKLGDSVQLAFLNKKKRDRSVNLAMTLRFGDEQSLIGTRVASDLLGPLMNRGSKTRTFQDISDLLDNTLSHVSFSSQPGALSVSISSDNEHYTQIIQLVGDLLRNPLFPEKEFREMVADRITGYQLISSQPQRLAEAAIDRALAPFAKTSFHYVPTLAERAVEFKAASLEDLRQLYEQQVGPGSVQFAAVGDFDRAVLEAELRKIFDGWAVKKPFHRVARPFMKNESSPMTIRTPDKPMAMIGMATALELDEDHADTAAIRIASYILGVTSNSRVANRLREKEGLSYDAYARCRPSPSDSVTTLTVYATCASENVGKTAAALREEVRRWIDTGVGEAELAEAKKGYRLAALAGLNDDASIADKLVRCLYLGRTMLWDAERLDKIDALTAAQVNDVLRRRLSDAVFFEVQAGDFATDAAPKAEARAGETR